MVKRCLKTGGYILWLTVAVAGLMEIAYRYQLVDFYRTEWQSLNPGSPGTGQKVLIIGDSFTAGTDAYPEVLRDSMPHADVRVAAVPGVGILEMGVITAARLREFQPDILVYQLYTGNDLWDIRKTTTSDSINFWRNLYWKASNYSLFLRYINYKSGQLKQSAGVSLDSVVWHDVSVFSPAQYNAREKTLFRAEPGLIQNTMHLRGQRAGDMDIWFREMDGILDRLPSSTQRVILVVIPHCTQVGRQYQKRMESIGAMPFDQTTTMQNFPFLETIKQHYRADERVEVCSVLPLFQKTEADGEVLYYENDPHLNNTGQQVLGAWLWEVGFKK